MTRISFFYFLLVPIMFYAQTGTIRGFVYEKESEEPIIFANIVLEGTDLGVVSDDNGYFIIPNVQPGNYTLKASFIGYNDSEQIVIINTDNLLITTKFFLTEQSITLQNVTVNAEREEQKKQVNTGVIKLTSKSINKLPSIGGEPDIAQFLQVLPGVIFTGDQGGQLYIRGGAPIHNKVL